MRSVEVAEPADRAGWSYRWIVRAELPVGRPVTIGRRHFSDRSKVVSRKQVILTLGANGSVDVRAVGSRRSFVLIGGQLKTLRKGDAAVALPPDAVISMDSSHRHRVRLTTRPQSPLAATRGCGANAAATGSVVRIDLTQERSPPPLLDRRTADARAGLSLPGPLPGESDTRAARQGRRWLLRPSRSIDDTPQELHYRIAESAFCRAGGQAARIDSVEYHLNVDLEDRWSALRERYDRRFGVGGHSIVFAFHGTPMRNVASIMLDGFKMAAVGSTTDSGDFGAGMYFSEFPNRAECYNEDSGVIILCKVLVGKPCMVSTMPGRPLQQGYTSHVCSANGSELVLFDEHAVLPLYLMRVRPVGVEGGSEALQGLDAVLH